MKQKNLEVINASFRYKSIRQIRCGKELLHGGKATHDCVGISGEIEKKQGRKLDPRITSQIICRGKKYIRKGLRRGDILKGKFFGLTKKEHSEYMKMEDAQARADYLKSLERKGKRIYAQTNREFGNVEMFNAVCDELRSLIESGENLDDHSKRLEGTYRPGGRNIRRRTLDDLWKWISQEYPKKLSAQEIEALRNQEYLKPLTRKERQFWKEFQAKNRDQEKIRRAAISA